MEDILFDEVMEDDITPMSEEDKIDMIDCIELTPANVEEHFDLQSKESCELIWNKVGYLIQSYEEDLSKLKILKKAVFDKVSQQMMENGIEKMNFCDEQFYTSNPREKAIITDTKAFRESIRGTAHEEFLVNTKESYDMRFLLNLLKQGVEIEGVKIGKDAPTIKVKGKK